MSWGMETPAAYTAEEIGRLLAELEHEDEYGLVLRAKGWFLPATGHGFISIMCRASVISGKGGRT